MLEKVLSKIKEYEMGGRFPLGKDSDFRLPDFKRSNTIKKQKCFQSEYAKLNTEEKRIKYLHYRFDLMCKQIVSF